MNEPCQIQLTCESPEKASTIARSLLEKRLVACVKATRVTSYYRKNSTIESAEEILLLMDTKSDNIDKIESEIGSDHSYRTMGIYATPISAFSNKASLWLNKEIKVE